MSLDVVDGFICLKTMPALPLFLSLAHFDDDESNDKAVSAVLCSKGAVAPSIRLAAARKEKDNTVCR